LPAFGLEILLRENKFIAAAVRDRVCFVFKEAVFPVFSISPWCRSY